MMYYLVRTMIYDIAENVDKLLPTWQLMFPFAVGNEFGIDLVLKMGARFNSEVEWLYT